MPNGSCPSHEKALGVSSEKDALSANVNKLVFSNPTQHGYKAVKAEQIYAAKATVSRAANVVCQFNVHQT